MRFLIHLGDPRAATALIEASRHKDDTFQREIVFALGELGGELMTAVARVMPALPVSLLAAALLEGDPEVPVMPLELHARTHALMRRLGAAGAHVYLPRDDEEYAVGVGLRMLVERRVLEERDGGWLVVPAERPLLRYYAAAIGPQLEAAGPADAPVALQVK
jgi:hypothetical protein